MSQKIEDYGEKIGGAKKDLWKQRGLMVSDFKKMNDRESEKYVTKDNIWQKPDYMQLVQDGLDIKVAYFRKLVRDALPRKPVFSYYAITEEEKRAVVVRYIEFVRALKEAVEQCESKYDVRMFFNPFLEKLGISSFFAPHDRNTERDFAAKDIVLDKNALLCPCEELKLESSIEEIYIKSEGWMTCDNLKAYMEQKKPWEHPVIEKICAQYVDFLGHQSSMDMSVEKFMNQSNLQDGKNVTVYCTDLINKVEIPVASFESSDEAIVAMEKLTLPYCYEDLNYYYDKKNMLYLENNKFTKERADKIIVSDEIFKPYKPLLDSKSDIIEDIEKSVAQDRADYFANRQHSIKR